MLNKTPPAAERIARPSLWPQLEIEFNHMGRKCLISFHKAKRMVEDMTWAIQEVEKTQQQNTNA